MNQKLAGPRFKTVGTRPVRPDGMDKVTGRAAYGADYAMAGMLVGEVKRSPHAHARILSIDTSAAKALPGVKAVITAADLPELEPDVAAAGEAMMNLAHLSLNCLARGKVLYRGHAVAAVAATTALIAEQATELIEVEYDTLQHVLDVEAAMQHDAPLLHDDLFTDGLDERPEKPSNIAQRITSSRGDIDKAFALAAVTIEGCYRTAATHQGYIEPHACVASVGADGQALLWCSTQGAFMVRTMCAAVVGMKQSDLRVIPSEIGGGFGGKTTVYLEPLVLALSRECGHPVKMVMNRNDVFRATGPAPATVMQVRLGATAEGKITAVDLELKYQAGAFPGSPVGAAVMTALACYDVPNFRITGWDVVSNTPKVAAYRAPGAPMAAFAIESALDDLALEVGRDPLELRLLNAVRDGVKSAYGPTFTNIGFEETLQAIRSHPHYSAPLGPNQGRGVAAGFWFNIGGDSTAMVSVNEDGSVVVATGNPDIGGSRASMAMMAAEVLGVPVDQVRAIVADTASIGFSMLTGGSRTTFATGMAVTDAATTIVGELEKRAALIWNVDEDKVQWIDGGAVCADAAKGELRLSLEEIAGKASKTGGPLSAEVSINARGAGPAFAVQLCDVEVDPETGTVTVLRYTAAQDVGCAIHPAYVEGQIQGGAAQGIGWALNEEYVYDDEGQMLNAGFLDYRMPVASDLPMIDAVIVEVPNPRHPFGVKGVGEAPIVPPLAAVANAVSAATGKRFQQLPMSPPAIFARLKEVDG